MPEIYHPEALSDYCISELHALINSKDPKDTIRGLQESGLRKYRGIEKELIAKLRHPDITVRTEALVAIARIQIKELASNIMGLIGQEEVCRIEARQTGNKGQMASENKILATAIYTLSSLGLPHKEALRLIHDDTIRQTVTNTYYKLKGALDDLMEEGMASHPRKPPLGAEPDSALLQVPNNIEINPEAVKNANEPVPPIEERNYEAFEGQFIIQNLRSLSFEDRNLDSNEVAQVLAHPSIEVKKETLLAIARMGYSAAVPDILSLIKTEVDPDLIAFACAVLETFGEKVTLEGIGENLRSMVEGRLVMARHDLAHNSYPELTEGNPMIH